MSKTNQATARSRRSIHDIYVRYRSVLARAVGRIVKPSDIDDILQETYIRTYAAVEKIEILHPRSFMLKTARNLALNHVTSAYSTRVEVGDLSDSDGRMGSGALDSQFDSQERFLVFCRAVRSLPDQCRRVFILKKVYGFSQREISKHLGISESTVEKHVAKGLSMCRDFLEAEGKSLPDGSAPAGNSGATRG